MISLSVTEAARGFSDLINRIRYQGESVLLLKGGKPVARMVPFRTVCTGEDLAREWPLMSRLDPEDAAEFEAELAASRANLGALESKWD